MKILFVRIGGKISGAEVYNINLLKELRRDRSLEVAFLTNLPTLTQELLRCKVTARTIPWAPVEIGTKKQLLKVLLAPGFIFKYFSMIHTLERGKKFDIVCFQSMTEKIFLTLVFRFLGYKVVWIEHGALFTSQASQIIKFFYTLSSIFCDKIIAVSHDTKNDLVHGGVSENRIEVLYIGVDARRFAEKNANAVTKIKNRLNIPKVATIIGYLGSVTKEKGIDDFIDVARFIFAKNNYFRFIIIGDGPDLRWMKRQTEDLQLGNSCIFTGFLSDIRPYLNIIDILLFPTRHHEGISMALLEAQAMGKVVIASNMGGNREIITHGENGYLYDHLDKEKITKQIIELSSNRVTMARIEKNARLNIEERFNIRMQAKKFIHLFESL